ncbi:tetratricopeptide repeat protein [Rhodocaloribacter sp.]
MKRNARFLIASLVFLLALVATVLIRRFERSSVPDRPVKKVRVDPSSTILNPERSLAYFRAEIEEKPRSPKAYVELAQVYLQRARTTGNEAANVPEARRLLDEALALDAGHYHARILKASLANTLHRFEDARDLALRLIEENDHHAFTWGILVDALVELGAYEEAIEACDRMSALRPGIGSYARVSYLRELHGDAGGALDAMKRAADAGVLGRYDRAWALYTLANLYLSGGKLDTAAYIFRGILEERPGFAPSIAGLGHVARIEGRTAEAVVHFRDAYAAEPRPSFLEGLETTYREAERFDEADALLPELLRSFTDARAMGERVDMEEADFLADHDLRLDDALRMARSEYERRPDHLHALETYAWTLYKNGRAAEAVPHITRALRFGTGDAMAHFRAGMIYRAAGHAGEAARQFRLALENRLHIEDGAAARKARAMLDALDPA